MSGRKVPVSEKRLKAYKLQDYVWPTRGAVELFGWECWRTYLLKYTPEMLPQNIDAFMIHDKTEEAFVLLQGRCTLFIAEGDMNSFGEIHAIEMEPLTIYQLKTNTWHHHPISKDGIVFGVMSTHTDVDHNTYFRPINDRTRAELLEIMRRHWSDFDQEYAYIRFEE